MPQWLDTMKNEWAGDAKDAIVKWFEEAADTSRNPLLIIDIDDYNKPVFQLIISSLIKSWSGPNEIYIKGAIEHLTKWYKSLAESQKKDELFIFYALIELHETFNCRLDIEYDDKSFIDTLEGFMGDFFFNFKKEYLQTLKFQDYFLYGLNSDVSFQKQKCDNILKIYGIDAKWRAAAFTLKGAEGSTMINAVRALETYIELLKQPLSGKPWGDVFTGQILPKALEFNKALVNFKNKELKGNGEEMKFEFKLTKASTEAEISAEIVNKSKLLDIIKKSVSEIVEQSKPVDYRSKLFPERIDTPIEFLKNLIVTFPKMKRDKLDSLKEIHNENLSLIEKAFEHENFNEVCFLDLMIAMVFHLTGYNAFYKEAITEKLNVICNWLSDYPFKRLNSKNGELIDKGFFIGFVEYFKMDLNVDVEQVEDVHIKNSKFLLKRCHQMLVFLLKLRTAKRYNESGFDNMSMFCDNFDKVNKVDLPWSDELVDLKKEFADIDMDIRSLNFRKDIQFVGGFNIRGTPIEQEFWQSLDDEIYNENTKMPMSYFLGLLSTEMGDCEMDDESFLNCLEGAFTDKSNFERFVDDEFVKPTINVIKQKIDNYKSAMVPDVIGPPANNLGNLNKMTYIYTNSIFKDMWENIYSINQIADMNPSKELDQRFDEKLSALLSVISRVNQGDVNSIASLKKLLGFSPDESEDKFFINVYNTCELFYYHIIPIIVAYHSGYFTDTVSMKIDKLVELLGELHTSSIDKTQAALIGKLYGGKFPSYEYNYNIVLKTFLTKIAEFFSADLVNKSDNLSHSERMELTLNSPLVHFLQVPKEMIKIDVNNLSNAGVLKRIAALLGFINIQTDGKASKLYERNANHNVFREILSDQVLPTVIEDSAATVTAPAAATEPASGPVNMKAIDSMIKQIEVAIDKKKGETWDQKMKIDPPLYGNKKENILHVTQMKYLLHYIYLNLLPLATKIQSFLSMYTYPRTQSKGGIKDILQWNVESDIPQTPVNPTFKLLLDFKDSQYYTAPAVGGAAAAGGGSMKGGACDLSSLQGKITKSREFIKGLPLDKVFNQGEQEILNSEFIQSIGSIDLHFKLLGETCTTTDLETYTAALEKPPKQASVKTVFKSIFKSMYYIFDKRKGNLERKLTIEEEYPIKQATDCFLINLNLFFKTSSVVIKTMEDSNVRNDDFLKKLGAGLLNLNTSDVLFNSMKYQTYDYAITKNKLNQIRVQEINLWGSAYDKIILSDDIKTKHAKWLTASGGSQMSPILGAAEHILKMQAFRMLLNVLKLIEAPGDENDTFSDRVGRVQKIKERFTPVICDLADVIVRHMVGIGSRAYIDEMGIRNSGAKTSLFNADPTKFKGFFVDFFKNQVGDYAKNTAAIDAAYSQLLNSKLVEESLLSVQRKKYNIIALDKSGKWRSIASDEIVTWFVDLVKNNINEYDLGEHLYPVGGGGGVLRAPDDDEDEDEEEEEEEEASSAGLSEEQLDSPLPYPNIEKAKEWCFKFVSNSMKALNWLLFTSKAKGNELANAANRDLLAKGGALESENAGKVSIQIGDLITNNLMTAQPASVEAPKGGAIRRITRKFKRKNYGNTFHKRK
jgi:hypothetical protein